MTQNTGMGSEGVAALAAVVPECPQLRRVYVWDCGLDNQDKAKLQALQRPSDHPQGELNVLT